MASDVNAEIEDLKKKLAQNPDSLIFVPLADAYRKAGMLDEAIDTCLKGLEKHPNYPSARVVLGRIYSEKEQYEYAIVELKKVEQVDMDNIMVHTMLGNIYLKTGKFAEAVSQFQLVLSLNPDDYETQEKLQEALSAKQETPKPAAKQEVKAEQKTAAKPEPKPEAKPEPKPEPKLEPKPEPKPALKPEIKPEIKPEPKHETKVELKPQPKHEEKKSEEDSGKALKVAELYTKKEEFDKAIEVYNELLSKDPDNFTAQQKLKEVYTFKEKKENREKERQKKAEAIEADKITAEDILDVMKEAVENDSVDEEKPREEKREEKKEEVKPAEIKKEEAKKEEIKKEEPKKADKKSGLDPKKGKELEDVLKKLQEVEGIVGSIFMDKEGAIEACVLPSKINKDEVSKTISSIVQKTEKSVKSMNQGRLNRVAITSESGVLTFTELKEGILFLIGNEKINVGKMGNVLKDVIERIKAVLA